MVSSLVNAETQRTKQIAGPIFFLHYIHRQCSVMKDQPGEESAFELSEGLPNIHCQEKSVDTLELAAIS
jgi:hypothetical protein